MKCDAGRTAQARGTRRWWWWWRWDKPLSINISDIISLLSETVITQKARRSERKDHFLSDKDERAEWSGALCYTGQTETGVSGWLHEDYATDNEHFFLEGSDIMMLSL